MPYIIIAVMGGGTTLEAVSGGLVPYWLGGAIVSLVVMGYVFLGGMRGTAWVNTFQTSLFLLFGTISVVVIGGGMGGFRSAMESLLASPATAPLLSRERVSMLYFFSYTFIPLSSITFPHIGIFCLTAKRLGHFKKTVILYPICMLLDLAAVGLSRRRRQRRARCPGDLVEARGAEHALECRAGPVARASAIELRAGAAGDDVILRLVDGYAPLWLASLLGAAVMAAVMASDSQILALSTMFTEDVFAFYGGKARFGEAVQVPPAAPSSCIITIVAYVIALRLPQSIFDVATQYAFAGYSALTPLLVGALFWRKSTRWGALAVRCGWRRRCSAWRSSNRPSRRRRLAWRCRYWPLSASTIITRSRLARCCSACCPVVPMTLISAALMSSCLG